MSEHEFTLILSGVDELDEAESNALYEAGLDDGSPGMRDGVAYIEVAREAATLEEAIVSAIKDVRRAGFGVVRVEPDDLVYLADMAERLGRTRESVRLWVTGQRGPGDFPAPINGLGRRTRLWSWRQVRAWLQQHHLVDELAENDPETIETINGALALLRHRAPFQLLDSLAQVGEATPRV